MKRLISVLTAISVALSVFMFSACSGNRDSAPDRAKAAKRGTQTEASVAYGEDVSVTAPETPTQQVGADYLAGLSDDDIEMLNIFLSNFSEAYVENLDTSDIGELIDFVETNTDINYSENITYDGLYLTKPGTNESFSGYMTADYVAERVDRFFGVTFEHQSSDDTYFYDGKYYISAADGECYGDFTKVTSATIDADGYITVEYDVYFYDYMGGPPYPSSQDRYKGIGEENVDVSICPYQYSGRAVLKERYFSESHANYQMVSLERTN